MHTLKAGSKRKRVRGELAEEEEEKKLPEKRAAPHWRTAFHSKDLDLQRLQEVAREEHERAEQLGQRYGLADAPLTPPKKSIGEDDLELA